MVSGLGGRFGGGLVTLGVAGLLFWQGRQTPVGQWATVGTPTSQEPTPQPMGGGRAVAPAKPSQEQEAITVIENLYQALSAQDWTQARLAHTPAMQSQFDPAFFAQFERVTVQDLRLTGRTGSQWQFLGRNTYVYRHGQTQEEERSYTVIWQNG